jgi:GntR family transcriptional regulator
VIARSPSLTEQVKQHLKERILNGDFEGGRIPAENDLAADLGVSRTTVRDALSRLEHEGAIVRKQGAGTFVNEAGLQIKSRLEEIWSYEEVLRDHGYAPSVEVLRAEIEPADALTARALGLVDGDDVIVVTKLFRENDEPVVVTANRISAALIDEAALEDAAAAVYDLLENHADRHLAYYLSEIVPVTLDTERARVLGVESGTAVISFEEIGYDQDDEPVVFARSFFRDDLLRFRLIRRKAV